MRRILSIIRMVLILTVSTPAQFVTLGGNGQPGTAPSYTEVQGCQLTTGGGGTCSFSSATTAGNTIACVISEEGSSSATITSVIHGGTETLAATANSPYTFSTPDTGRLFIYTYPSITSTSKSVAMTSSASESYAMICQEFHGPTAVDLTPAGCTGTSSAISCATGATHSANEVLFGITVTSFLRTETGTFSIPATCPSPTSCAVNEYYYEAYHQAIVSSIGSYTLQSSNTGNWAALLATLK
jgi:hypothetical protein